MYLLGKQIIIPHAGSPTANSSLAPQIGTPLYKLRSFSNQVHIAGLYQGPNGHKPVIFTSRDTRQTLTPSVQEHPFAVTKT